MAPPPGAGPVHSFQSSPHRTLIALSLPVLFSMIAEPLTGLVDTAFVARLGASPLAALGVGTAALSSTFWIFNFLSIGTQTEVAQALGRGDRERAKAITSLALILSALFGLLLMAILFSGAGVVARLLGAAGQVEADAIVYIRYRLVGGPAVLLLLTAFGALRGLQDMRTPLWIALAINGLNIGLDALLIFGWGPVPALGIAGAALASAASQWLGAGWVLAVIGRRLGFAWRVDWSEVTQLLSVGRDLFIRTGLLTLFLLLATRIATQAGAGSGAAYTAIRQVFIFTALFLDAFAITAQSLVGFFIGAGQIQQARRVVAISSLWALATGCALGLAMWLGESYVTQLLVPAEAGPAFGPAWLISALLQPPSALAFLTDGVHWGTGDYAFLRNATGIATTAGGLGLALIDPLGESTVTWIMVATTVWVLTRAGLGLLRVWPGIGRSPFRPASEAAPQPL
ncbi:MAG TPA: MATE family efflux transporter [Anaerolineae bacterium]|nr:MATE family efflux transporter [Anaerolineae bacterium]